MSPVSIQFLSPELLLILVGTLIYVGGAFSPARPRWSWVAMGGLVVAGLLLAVQGDAFFWPEGAKQAKLAVAIDGPLVADQFGQYARWLALDAGLLFALMTTRLGRDVLATEYWGTLVMAVAGVMLVAAARDLVLLFVGLELLSIPTYVLLYLGRRDAASQESAVKYFFLSILSSALLLYGFSFLYGLAGSTDLAKLYQTMAQGNEALAASKLLARVALVLVFAGLGFRITAVPFHFYAPDVYQGTTNGNAGVLAVFPKIAGFVALVRVLVIALPGMEAFGWRVALIVAVMTMTVGNLLALWQDNLRRLMAYSSIAHAGYMLIGLASALAATASGEPATSFDGLAALLFYLAVYTIATIGTFAAVVYIGQPERQIDRVDELAGLGRSYPGAGICLAVFMFSLAGIPPLAGFWGKLSLFASALSVDGGTDSPSVLRNWFLTLAVLGVLNAAIAAAYYLRIVGVVYFGSGDSPAKGQGGRGAAWAMVASALLVVGLGCFPSPLVQSSLDASKAARTSPAAVPKPIVAQPAPADQQPGRPLAAAGDTRPRAP